VNRASIIINRKMEIYDGVMIQANLGYEQVCPVCKGEREIKYVNPHDPKAIAFPTMCTFCKGGGTYIKIEQKIEHEEVEFYKMVLANGWTLLNDTDFVLKRRIGLPVTWDEWVMIYEPLMKAAQDHAHILTHPFEPLNFIEWCERVRQTAHEAYVNKDIGGIIIDKENVKFWEMFVHIMEHPDVRNSVTETLSGKYAGYMMEATRFILNMQDAVGVFKTDKRPSRFLDFIKHPMALNGKQSVWTG